MRDVTGVVKQKPSEEKDMIALQQIKFKYVSET